MLQMTTGVQFITSNLLKLIKICKVATPLQQGYAYTACTSSISLIVLLICESDLLLKCQCELHKLNEIGSNQLGPLTHVFLIEILI